MSGFKRIVLIDDDIDDHEIFGLAIAQAAPDIDCVYYDTAQTALDDLIGQKLIPDLIFLDLNMPRMNGLQLLQKLKEHEETAKLRVIIYSTTILADVQAELSRIGVYSSFIKPFSHKDLIDTLKGIFAKIPSLSGGDSATSV